MHKFAVSEGARTEVDEVCLGPTGGQPAVATGLDVRETRVDEVLRVARSCFLSIVICKTVSTVAACTLL